MSTQTEHLATEGIEPIPGYRLVTRLGVGGYGEVWKATAPGGLLKAVKLIHGHVEDSRAVREFRSLRRARTLNHPFLVSLERIEIVDGQLIIVTELADSTLKDKFDQYRQTGLPGIPREELLVYISEAADALDYLFESHSLQHLDVKPENLLLVGKHIKVADFGLMKDLQESCPSLVSGLTPRYSAPEMFGGKPGRHSDQYSLAIVYQEMVSGRCPFNGSNIAALASQHLHCTPDLATLNPLERFAVGKALSKEPERRFTNCHEFATRLMHRSGITIVEPMGKNPSVLSSSQGTPLPETCDFAQPTSAVSPTNDGQTIPLTTPEIHTLAPISPLQTDLTYRPTMFLGLGGVGGQVLERLYQLLTDRLGELSSIPTLQFLHVDTDNDAQASAACGSWQDGLPEEARMVTPLRQTRDYRTAVVSNLDSISRRWIYNVPRSLRTEGFRALGRLALLDHADRLLERLRRMVRACTSPQAILESATHSPLPFREVDPRVFVIASIAGGTGGGMVIDIGYAVRQVLTECGFSDEEVCGLLTYSNAPASTSCSFAPANALACLKELRYFSQPGCDFPGEPACQLAAFQEDGPTFPNTYLYDMGERITSGKFSEATDTLAEYLMLNTVSPMSLLLETSRQQARNRLTQPSLSLRTFGLCPLGTATREDPSALSELLCRFLIRKWKVGLQAALHEESIDLSDFDRLYAACDSSTVSPDPMEALSQAKMTELKLTTADLSERMDDCVLQELGCDPVIYLRSVIVDSLQGSPNNNKTPESPVSIAVRRLRAIVGHSATLSPETTTNQVASLRDHLLPQAKQIGCTLGRELAETMLTWVNTENTRLAGARRAASSADIYLQDLQQQALAQLESTKRELDGYWSSIAAIQHRRLPRRRSARRACQDLLETYAQLLLRHVLQEAVCKVIKAILPSVNSVSDQLRELWKGLNQFLEEFSIADQLEGEWTAAAKKCEPHHDMSTMAGIFFKHKDDLIEKFDQDVFQQCFAENSRLSKILTHDNQARACLARQMRSLSRQIILQACRDTSYTLLKQVIQEGGEESLQDLLLRSLEQAQPELLSLGGSQRLLAGVPHELDLEKIGQQVEQVAGHAASLVWDRDGELQFCYEIEDLPAKGMETRLIRQRHDCQELAARLHTRINCDWMVV